MDDAACGEEFQIDAVDVVGDDRSRETREGVTLVCSRPLNHTPRELHSDGVTDWMGD
jgi:hypothetical protein